MTTSGVVPVHTYAQSSWHTCLVMPVPGTMVPGTLTNSTVPGTRRPDANTYLLASEHIIRDKNSNFGEAA